MNSMSTESKCDFDTKRKFVDPFCAQFEFQLVKYAGDEITVVDNNTRCETTVPMWFIRQIQRSHIKSSLAV